MWAGKKGRPSKYAIHSRGGVVFEATSYIDMSHYAIYGMYSLRRGGGSVTTPHIAGQNREVPSTDTLYMRGGRGGMGEKFTSMSYTLS